MAVSFNTVQCVYFFCIMLTAANSITAVNVGDCYQAGKGMINHNGFDNKPAYVFNGVRNSCIVAVLSMESFDDGPLCSGDSRSSIGVQDDNLQALMGYWNNSVISQLSEMQWYVKMDSKNATEYNCYLWDSIAFTISYGHFCWDDHFFICEYQFNDCAYNLLLSSQLNSTKFLFPSDYRYSKGLGTGSEHGGCYFTVPTIDEASKNKNFNSCSATCTTGNGTPPSQFTVYNGSLQILSCSTHILCPALDSTTVSSTADSPSDLFIAIIVLVVAIISLVAVVVFVCYKRNKKMPKKATFRRRINSQISFTTENQPTSSATPENDPLKQTRTMDSLKSMLGSAKIESNRGSIKVSPESNGQRGAKGSHVKKNVPKNISHVTSKL